MVLRTVLRLGRRNLLDISCIDSRAAKNKGAVVYQAHSADRTIHHLLVMANEHIPVRADERAGVARGDSLRCGIGRGYGTRILTREDNRNREGVGLTGGDAHTRVGGPRHDTD